MRDSSTWLQSMTALMSGLVGGFFEQTLGHHELDVLTGDTDLLEAVPHSAKRVRNELKSRRVKDRFLDAGDEAEAEVLADLAKTRRKLRSRIIW